MELKSISGVEIFAVGKWNGDEYTDADLDSMVAAFELNKATIKPAIKLGHDENQKLLQRDGFPAAGWIGNVYRKGSKLVADFVDMPEKIYELIKRKAYRKVSSEIYWNIDINGVKYPRMLAAVSLLGGDMPAVTCLDDVLALYAGRKSDARVDYTTGHPEATLKEYVFEESEEVEGMGKNEADKETQEKLETLEAQAKQYKADLDAKAAEADAAKVELETLRKYREDAEIKIAEAAKATQEAKLDAAVAEMGKAKDFSPAMAQYARALIGEEKKEYAFGEEKLDRAGLVASLLKLHSQALGVNFDEKTTQGDEKKTNSEADLDEKIRKFAAENKVSYSAAYKAVMKS